MSDDDTYEDDWDWYNLCDGCGEAYTAFGSLCDVCIGGWG